MISPPLLYSNDKGLYCAAGDFYIDPWRGVERAIITHAHSDHARSGSSSYLCAEPGLWVLKSRLGPKAIVESLPYGQVISLNGVKVSLHPAGHILGSAQVRVEYRGEVWVVTGDYKRQVDPTCDSFDPVVCHTLITESTFGLPVYKWNSPAEVFQEINAWWADQASIGKQCILVGYSLGKVQRMLASLNTEIGPIYVHEAILKLNAAYEASGILLPKVKSFSEKSEKPGLWLMPPSALYTPGLLEMGSYSTGFASGWMALRNARKRNAFDKGFTLSDHADWNGLLQTIQDSRAEKVLVTHGFKAALVRYLNESGTPAAELETHFTGETAGSSSIEEEYLP
jgi:putative mRNA 3-end processing factor